MAHVYKALWTVEDIFRTTKSILETRPIYHKRDVTIRGHVFCSFLALLLKQELESRLKQADLQWEWKEVIRGLDALQQVEASPELASNPNNVGNKPLHWLAANPASIT